MLLTFIVMFFVGILFGMVAYELGRNTKEKIAVFFLLTFTIMAILTGAFTVEAKLMDLKWNDGYCECGGEWELLNSSTHGNLTHSYYQCEDCEKIIELTQKRA